MKLPEFFRVIILSSIVCWMFQSSVSAIVGISTRFVDVTIERLEIGKSYNIRKLRNVPYAVKNRGNTDMEIKVEVTVPKSNELVKGYEAIPDPTWIQIMPNKFNVPADQMGYAEMIIQIPNDPKYAGKHYQAKIIAKTVNVGLFAAGTESRLRFSVGPGPETLEKEEKEKTMMTLDFDITPSEMYVSDLEPGKTYNINKLAQKKLKITNRAETPIKMRFNSIKWLSSLDISGDYVPAPDPLWLTFSPSEKTMKGERIETIDPMIKIPASDEYRGKKYAFLLKVDLIMGVELEVYSKIYVTIKEKSGR